MQAVNRGCAIGVGPDIDLAKRGEEAGNRRQDDKTGWHGGGFSTVWHGSVMTHARPEGKPCSGSNGRRAEGKKRGTAGAVPQFGGIHREEKRNGTTMTHHSSVRVRIYGVKVEHDRLTVTNKRAPQKRKA